LRIRGRRRNIISEDSRTAMSKGMLPHSAKKKIELEAVVDYHGGRVTGHQFVGIMNRIVLGGERTGKYRGRGRDFGCSCGVLEYPNWGEKRVAKRTLSVPVEVAKRIRQDGEEKSLGLSRSYRLPIPVMKRAPAFGRSQFVGDMLEPTSHLIILENIRAVVWATSGDGPVVQR
jgi:hypothetical protein